MSQWNKEFLFSFETITKSEPQKLYAWKPTKSSVMENILWFRSLLDGCVILFTSV